MNTKILTYIIAIAEEKSVSKASERVYLSQPMLSLHLKNLEEEYGAPFFIRNKNEMQLTQAGILFINNAKLILHKESQLEQEIASLLQKEKKSLRIIIDDPFYNYFIAEVLPSFQTKQPDFLIEVSNSNALQAQKALREEQAELAIFTSAKNSVNELETMVLIEDSLVPILPPNYAFPKDGLQQAYKNGLVPLLHPIGTTARLMEEEYLASIGIFPTTVMQSTSYHITLNLMQTLNCFAFIPNQMRKWTPNLNLTFLPNCYNHNCLLAYSPKLALNDAVQDVLQLSIEKFAYFAKSRQHPLHK